MKLPIRLSKAQRNAKEALVALLMDEAEADRRYNALADSHGGRVISTDLARFLDTRYRDTPTGRPRDLVPSWDLAWRYAQSRLARELKYRGSRKMVRFMAGGWGAGKTHAVDHAAVTIPDLVWDGTLKDSRWARRMVDLSLKYGWHVEIVYVFRDIELALYGALERGNFEGRSVPLVDLASNHRAVQLSIRRLLKRFGDHRNISVILLHNTGSKEIKSLSLIISELELAPKGALHYSPRHEAYFTEAARKIEARNS
jgi:hypothetical protein